VEGEQATARGPTMRGLRCMVHAQARRCQLLFRHLSTTRPSQTVSREQREGRIMSKREEREAMDAVTTIQYDPHAIEAYGALREGVHIAGYTFERACGKLEWLLENDRWRGVGDGFSDVNEFMASIRLDTFRPLAEQRKRIAQRIKELQPKVSNRQIAKTLGVDHKTVSNDLAGENSPRSAKKISEITQRNPSGGEFSPPAVAGAEAAKLVQRKERAQEQREENAAVATRHVIVPAGRFGTIVIDPPWEMEKIERDVRPNQVAFDYPTMTVGEIIAFRGVIDAIAADDCHLFLWTTQKFLPSAFKIIEAWDFRYVLEMVWCKGGGFQPLGLPQYNIEFILYARRGTPRFIDTKAFNCGFYGERREHSRKPDEFYDVIRRVTPEPRIDMFSRESRVGFAQHGNEQDRFTVSAAE
jgi:N6-adenosine-specific RNA methylase IME4